MSLIFRDGRYIDEDSYLECAFAGIEQGLKICDQARNMLAEAFAMACPLAPERLHEFAVRCIERPLNPFGREHDNFTEHNIALSTIFCNRNTTLETKMYIYKNIKCDYTKGLMSEYFERIKDE